MTEAMKLINPQPRGHKARRGDCGTCHWFERVPEQPSGDNPWAGWCLYAPPVCSQTMVPAGLGPQGPMMKPAMQGLVPPTYETRRCHLWRPFGTMPTTPWNTIGPEVPDGQTD
jgi:hypothetical protein